MGNDRHSKSTERFDEQELRRLAASGRASGATAQRASATVRREIRPTCKIHKDELVDLIDRATRPASEPGLDLEVELQVFDPAPIAPGTIAGSLSPELALDLLEQGITDEPPELHQSEQPFGHSIQPEPDLAAEVARRRKAAPTAPMSTTEIAAASNAGETPAIRVRVSSPAVEVARDYWMLAAIAAAIVAVTMIVLFAL